MAKVRFLLRYLRKSEGTHTESKKVGIWRKGGSSDSQVSWMSSEMLRLIG
jgi:hypothetical protein